MVSAVPTVGLFHARYRCRNRTSSTRRGTPAIVAFSQAKRLSFDHRPASGCFGDPLRMGFQCSRSSSKENPTVTRAVTVASRYGFCPTTITSVSFGTEVTPKWDIGGNPFSMSAILRTPIGVLSSQGGLWPAIGSLVRIASPYQAPYFIAGGAFANSGCVSPPSVGIGIGLDTSHPAPSPSAPGPSHRSIWPANVYASESFGEYSNRTDAFGFPFRAATNFLKSSRRPLWCFATSSRYFRSANCACAASSWALAVFCCSLASAASLERDSSVALVNSPCNRRFSVWAFPAASLASPASLFRVAMSSPVTPEILTVEMSSPAKPRINIRADAFPARFFRSGNFTQSVSSIMDSPTTPMNTRPVETYPAQSQNASDDPNAGISDILGQHLQEQHRNTRLLVIVALIAPGLKVTVLLAVGRFDVEAALRPHFAR